MSLAPKRDAAAALTCALGGVLRLDSGWRMTVTAAGAVDHPDRLCLDAPNLARSSAYDWIDATVPGTVADTLRRARRFDADAPMPLDDRDYWYRLGLSGRGKRILRLHGLATLCEVWLNGTCVLKSDNMFVSHEVAIELGSGDAKPCGDTLHLCFRALGQHLRALRGRARWRPQLIATPQLRFVRTTLLGHMPGWCPPVAPIGPWRAVELVDPAVPLTFERTALRASLDGSDGVIDLTIVFAADVAAGVVAGCAADVAAPFDAVVRSGTHAARLVWRDARTLIGRLRIADAPRWWPRTHGEPVLHPVELSLGDHTIALGSIGFRTIEVDRGDDAQGFALVVNGVRIFCRGACWTSAGLIEQRGDRAAYAPWLEQACGAGLNMVRVGGTMVYEDDTFYALCDELGLLVWHDFMFSNCDYPGGDAAFAAQVTLEAEQFLTRTQHRASLAVLCGASEVAQQAAMLGLSAAERATPLFSDTLASVAERLRADVPYLAHTPSGGALPFMPRTGVSHYYGVGAYRRSLDDARRADVRFASECLAFANVPCDETLDGLGVPVHHPRWKRGVPRDSGASWDFDDVREHYLQTHYGIDAARLRHEDPVRYLDLSRAVVADLISDVFSEWRRLGSRCAGGIVWQLRDLAPGAGWGVLDALCRPKSAWHALRQVSQPQQVLLVDEGLNGLDVHVLNERPQPLRARLEVLALRNGETVVARAGAAIEVPARGAWRANCAELLGRFFDYTYAYRFGPRDHDVVIASLHRLDPDAASLGTPADLPLGTPLAARPAVPLSQACYLPDPRAGERCDQAWQAALVWRDEAWWVDIETRRFARRVHIAVPGFIAEEDWFHIAPGRAVQVRLRQEAPAPDPHGSGLPVGEIRAINALRPITIRGTR